MRARESPTAAQRARLDDGAGQLTGGGGTQAEVEEARPGDLHGINAVELGEAGHEELGQRARIGSGLLGQLHGDIGGPIAVITVSGALDSGKRHLLDRQGERAVVDGSGQNGVDRFSELFGSHEHRVAEWGGRAVPSGRWGMRGTELSAHQ